MFPREDQERDRPARVARAGDRLMPVRLEGPLGRESLDLPPSQGHVALVLFSTDCFQCQNELGGADDLDARASSLPGTQIVWASVDDDPMTVIRYLHRRKMSRRFVMLDSAARSVLLGPGKPPLPVTLVVSPGGVEAKFIGAAAAGEALDWIERRNN